MAPDFQHVMHEATRLTRAGDLSRATAAIQAALSGQPATASRPDAVSPAATPRAHEADIIDVEVREVRPETDANAGTPHRRADTDASGSTSAPRAWPTSHDPVDAPSLTQRLRQAASHLPRVDMPGLSQMATHATTGFSWPGVPAHGPTGLGADAASDDPRFSTGTFSLAGDQRDYKQYVPSAAGARPLPLIVMLHGCTQNPDDFAAGTRMNAIAEQEGFYVLYPAQSTRMNPQRCWNWFKHTHQQRGRGEPALIAGMVREMMAHHAIDPDRVYVAGLSAGGAMAAILGDTYPDLFAAVGVHSGLAAGTATDLPSALSAMRAGAPGGAGKGGVPTIVFHGDADTTVHPSNGDHVISASTGGAVAEPAERLRADGALGSTRRVYRDGQDGPVIAEHWLVHGAAHAWSGGSAQGSYTEARGPDASTHMLRFFLAHPRRAVH